MTIIPLLLSLCLWLAIVVAVLRVLSTSGVPLARIKYSNFILADKQLKNSFTPTAKEAGAVFGLAFLFRVIVFFLSVFAIFILTEKEFNFTSLIDSYMVWDAKNYERIAIGGYTHYVENGDYVTLVFFPLYSWIVRIFASILQSYRVSGLLVSWLLYSGACTYLYKLLALDYNKSTTQRTVIYISVFPHALFFGVMMNESLLLFTSVVTLYYIRRHDWVKVGIFGALAALSRMAGLLLAFPAAVEWFEHYRISEKLGQKNLKEVWQLFYKKGLWIFLMLIGTGIYLFCNYQATGDWFIFFEYEEEYWNQGFTYFGNSMETVFEYLKNRDSFTRFAIWLPEAITLIFIVSALLYGIRRHRNMYSVYLIVYFIVSAGAKWPISVCRYMTCAVPAFIVLSDFSERHKWTEPLITSVMAIAFGIFFTAYFMGKQIL